MLLSRPYGALQLPQPDLPDPRLSLVPGLILLAGLAGGVLLAALLRGAAPAAAIFAIGACLTVVLPAHALDAVGWGLHLPLLRPWPWAAATGPSSLRSGSLGYAARPSRPRCRAWRAVDRAAARAGRSAASVLAVGPWPCSRSMRRASDGPCATARAPGDAHSYHSWSRSMVSGSRASASRSCGR